jgi:hypothetical protein
MRSYPPPSASPCRAGLRHGGQRKMPGAVGTSPFGRAVPPFAHVPYPQHHSAVVAPLGTLMPTTSGRPPSPRAEPRGAQRLSQEGDGRDRESPARSSDPRPDRPGQTGSRCPPGTARKGRLAGTRGLCQMPSVSVPGPAASSSSQGRACRRFVNTFLNASRSLDIRSLLSPPPSPAGCIPRATFSPLH